MMDAKQVKNIIEACLLVAGKAMSVRQIDNLFEGDEHRPDKETIKACLEELQTDYEGRGIELVQVASGYRLQSRTEVSEWVARLFPEKPPRYSRALLETLVLVAYRQPITRGEIEEIRGVAVSSNIVKTLQEREWVKEVGFKDVPGKPALLGTTRQFLDYFNLKRLDDLPPLADVKNLDEMDAAFMEAAGIAPAQDSQAANDGEMSEEHQEANAGEHQSANADGVNVEENQDVSAEEHQDVSADEVVEPKSEATMDVVATDDKDAPVTFAGLVSDLPPLQSQAEDELNDDDNAVRNETDEHVVENTDAESINDEQLNNEQQQQAEHSAETVDEEQQKLLSKISDFAEEHQKDVQVRDELESQLETRYIDSKDSESADLNPQDGNTSREVELVTAESDEQELSESSQADSLGDAIDASAASIDVLSDTFTGDVPSAGETLH